MQTSTTISTSRCSDEPMAMQDILGELWATTSVPLNERRRLAGRLLALRLAQASGSSLSPMASFEAEQLSDYEDILFSAGQALGMTTKPTITAVKTSLRQRGGHQLASRLGRLSKARNTTAHPDVGLRSEVLDVLAKPIEENIDTQAKTTKEATTPDKVGQWYAMSEPEQEAQDNSDDPGGKIAELTNTIQEQHKQIERLKQELEQQHVAQQQQLQQHQHEIYDLQKHIMQLTAEAETARFRQPCHADADVHADALPVSDGLQDEAMESDTADSDASSETSLTDAQCDFIIKHQARQQRLAFLVWRTLHTRGYLRPHGAAASTSCS